MTDLGTKVRKLLDQGVTDEVEIACRLQVSWKSVEAVMQELVPPRQVATFVETGKGNAAVVHGDAPLSDQSKPAMEALIDAATEDMKARRRVAGSDPACCEQQDQETPAPAAVTKPKTWTPERIETLKALWNDGLSAAEIAEEIGVSKNTVIGKAYRLDLERRPSPIKPKPKPKLVDLTQPFPTTDQPHEPVGCRWIEGDVQEGEWRYCQAPQKTGSSYCEHHHPRCYRRANAEEVA